MDIRFVGVKSARETVNAFGLVTFVKILWRVLFYHAARAEVSSRSILSSQKVPHVQKVFQSKATLFSVQAVQYSAIA